MGAWGEARWVKKTCKDRGSKARRWRESRMEGGSKKDTARTVQRKERGVGGGKCTQGHTTRRNTLSCAYTHKFSVHICGQA